MLLAKEAASVINLKSLTALKKKSKHITLKFQFKMSMIAFSTYSSSDNQSYVVDRSLKFSN